MNQDQPMICHKCYKYAHTKKQCRQKRICRKCSGGDNLADYCKNELRCPNGGKGHMDESTNCEAQEKERSINEVQTTVAS